MKIVYHPDFITPTNRLWGIEYDQFVRDATWACSPVPTSRGATAAGVRGDGDPLPSRATWRVREVCAEAASRPRPVGSDWFFEAAEELQDASADLCQRLLVLQASTGGRGSGSGTRWTGGRGTDWSRLASRITGHFDLAVDHAVQLSGT